MMINKQLRTMYGRAGRKEAAVIAAGYGLYIEEEKRWPAIKLRWPPLRLRRRWLNSLVCPRTPQSRRYSNIGHKANIWRKGRPAWGGLCAFQVVFTASGTHPAETGEALNLLL